MKSNTVPVVSASTLALIALLLLFGPLLRLLTVDTQHPHFHIFHHVFTAVNVVSLPVVGVLLLYTAIYVYYRRFLAIVLSGGLCLILLVYLPIFYAQMRVTPLIVTLIAVYLVLIVIRYKEFTIKNSLEGIAPYLRRISLIAFFGFIYGIAVFSFLGFMLFRSHFSLLDSIGLTIDSLTIFSGTISEPTRLGGLFIDSLGGIGIVIFILLLEALFRPLRLKIFSHQHRDRQKAETIIKLTSRSSEDFFKLWPEDKNYFFSNNDEAFIAYKQSGKTIIALGDPTGNEQEFPVLVHGFIDYCTSLGWLITVINATPDGQKLYEKNHLASLFIGSEGVVDIRHFIDSTASNKHFRYVVNKAGRDKLEVVEREVLTHEYLLQLSSISREWLRRGNRREYTLFMGYFDRKYLEKSRIFVLLQNNKPVGYVNLIPSFYEGHASIDHLRSKNDTSSIGMHFLIMKVIKTLNDEGVKTLNIGLAPLSGIEKNKVKLLPRAVFKFIRTFGSSYYSFSGLEQFKNKFEPSWEPRSILYSGSANGLIRISRDIEHASTFNTRGNRYVYLSTVAGVIVLALVLLFILD